MGADGLSFASDEARYQRAALGLSVRCPHLSARGALPKAQRTCLIASAGLLIALALFLPSVAYWTGFGLFCILIVWRAALVVLARSSSNNMVPAKLNDDELPTYSILVALYDEARTLPGLITALKALSYPAHKLDVHLLLEDKDLDTRAAINALTLPENFFVHTLAPGTPQTKPRALNYGLEFAAGAYVTIYDAEDRPHPQQLRKAAETFAASHQNTVCLQAPLVAHNSRESWIAAQWALEYDIQFGLLVPALSQMECPIPLGGTSNHFRRDALLASGGWDAWNVTEDADLGLRLARFGYKIGTIDLPTYEEAPEGLFVWATQRSRWIKGFIQSWLVVMRQPFTSARQMGMWNWLAMQITLGGAILSACLAGPMALWLLICLLHPDLNLGTTGYVLLSIGYGVNVIAALLTRHKLSAWRLTTVATLPLYWPLLSLGAARALYGLAITPHFWAKTPHGLTAAGMDEGLPHCSPSIGSSPFAR